MECIIFISVIFAVSRALCIEDIARWREDTNFMYQWQEQYLTRGVFSSETLKEVSRPGRRRRILIFHSCSFRLIMIVTMGIIYIDISQL